ncbi:chitin deacetylase 1-like [Physella acuta]|uniref:chitin deacetylase 1-like n=1 Tax=Physella acuta TaxID=109671 RepID=UPI0027DDDE67|nr:chitin deacetylase 1-like [Physella acuta]
MKFASRIIVLVWVAGLWCEGQDNTWGPCEQEVNCELPACFCANNTQGPEAVPATQRPHIVVLTFNDAVNERNFDYYSKMLTTGWKNSNGCPVRLTLFVSDTWTNYTQVQKLWLAGAEVAAFSKSGYGQTEYFYKTITKEKLREEIGGQKQNFVKKAKIPPYAIRGFRIPYFSAAGDDMFDVLAEENYDYDSSLLITRDSMQAPPTWPATLTYKWPFKCKLGHCPLSNHSSIWEVPVQMLYDLNDTFECQYIDACTNAPTTEEGAFQLLWRNFLPYYKSRTPFVLNMRATWLNTDFQRTAFHRLVYSIMDMPEVYFVTMSQLVDWMKNATSLNEIQNFEPWLCPKRELYQSQSSTLRGDTTLLPLALVSAFIVHRIIFYNIHVIYNVSLP